MKRSTNRILTTHAGVLSGPPEFADIDLQVRTGKPYDAQDYAARRRDATFKTVRRQADIGIDVVSDGELGKSRGYPYYSQRITGIEQRALRPGEIPVTVRRSRERLEFAEFYDYLQKIDTRLAVPPGTRLVCTAPLVHLGLGKLQEELEAFRAALAHVRCEEAFFPVIAPGWLDHFMFNEYYGSDEEFIYAIADILRPEYRGVVDAGFLLQVDDPGLPDAWPTFIPAPSIEEYRRYAAVRIEALNYALEGIPEDKVRYHVCWGSHHGPHTDDIPLKHIVDLMLKVRAQGYSLEAANARHEHEWKLWRDIKLPEGKILIPGVVGHASNVIEHPELVAERIMRFASVIGRENVIAGTDCGMGGRVHPQIGWAKLQALTEGAALASRELWPA
ncbi:MAG: cobalamin-independent methionine synthase II family protein [Alphaproteobacteria bacterium]|nr:cobalamin-independent methionine synthase II family protein [Alphaproteobacteria bacterium]